MHIGVVPGIDDDGQVRPHAPQLLTSVSTALQDVGLAAGQGKLAEAVLGPQVPSASPVVAAEQA
jgi:hypothetical protein